jgi:hypothetical protein
MMGIALALLLSLARAARGLGDDRGRVRAPASSSPKPARRRSVGRGWCAIGHFFVPIFFVSVGAAVDLRAFGTPDALLLGRRSSRSASSAKVVRATRPGGSAGASWWSASGMIPRGEVGLIFAQMGLAAAVHRRGEYAAIMLMVMTTTFAAPVALRALYKKARRPGPEATNRGRRADQRDLTRDDRRRARRAGVRA